MVADDLQTLNRNLKSVSALLFKVCFFFLIPALLSKVCCSTLLMLFDNLSDVCLWEVILVLVVGSCLQVNVMYDYHTWHPSLKSC